MLRTLSKLSPIQRKAVSSLLNSSTPNSAKNIAVASAVASSTDFEPKWQLMASACITRYPIISPDLSHIEKQYKEYLEKREVELSLLSDHEMRLMEDKLRDELILRGEQDTLNLDEAAKQTMTEFEDASTEELKRFKFAEKVTEADENGDHTSLNRKLDRSLVLVAKQKLGSQHHWVLPQTPWNPGETLKQSCERLVKDICGAKVKVKILGNSPCGFFKYKYPKEVRKNGFIGAKVFFFSGHVSAYDSRGLEPQDNFPEFLWLTHEDLSTKLSKSYSHAVSQFMISDQ